VALLVLDTTLQKYYTLWQSVEAMARLKLSINEELMAKVSACANRVWPAQGVKAVARFIHDTIRRYLNYRNGTGGSTSNQTGSRTAQGSGLS
jgi:hypothetical protein